MWYKDRKIDCLVERFKHTWKRSTKVCMLTVFPEKTSYLLSTVTRVKALDSEAVSIEHIVTPIIIQNTENSRAIMDLGVLSPYLGN